MDMDPSTLRALERILVVLASAMSIFLGYRLFLAIPRQQSGEGKLELPGGVSIFVTRVGPGVFFALFGAVVIAFSLHESITYAQEDPRSGARITYSGIGQELAPREHEGGDADRLEVRLSLEFLNSLGALLREDLPPDDLVTVERRRRQIKLLLMSSVWDDDWGDWELFRLWAEGGALEPVPPQIAAAADYFRSGEAGP